MAEYKEPVGKTKEKYDLFVLFYLESFNATQSAIKAGYSKKTARQQGSRLLTNVYVREKIQSEMERLRDRMKDEGLRSFSMLLGIALETEEKIQQHNEAEQQLERLAAEINGVNRELSLINRSIQTNKRHADALDGRKKGHKERKREYLQIIDDLDSESFDLQLKRADLFAEQSKYEAKYLNFRDWEKLQSLKKSVFQDILDRGGFKALDKIEHSGSIQTPGVNPQLSSLNKEDLEALVNLGQSITASSS